ncbi:MAG: CHASE domain-containing protein [Bacteroidetes bacterium]|nr:CHASE domain-containing protein [Bacteroidota bacterium]
MNASYDSIIKNTAEQKKTSIFQFSKTYPAFIALVIGLVLSILIWNYVSETVRTDREAAFDKAASSVMNRLQTAYDRQYQILNSFERLYKNSVQVVRGVFELYGSIPTSSYPSILSVSYVPSVKAKEKEEFVYYARSERYFDYVIHPQGDRDYYYPIEYIVPLDKNLHRSGFDLATQPEAAQTIELAQKNEGIFCSPFYNVRPDTMGFLLLFNVQKKITDPVEIALKGDKIDGVVMVELDAKSFFNSAITNNPASGDTSITFECFDKTTGSQSIFASTNRNIQPEHPLLVEDRKFEIANREIHVQFATVPNFGGQFQGILPLIALLGGVVTSFIGFGFVLSIVTARARALDIADKMTRSQRRIVESSQDIIAVMDLSGSWKSLSPAVKSVLQYSEAELVGKTIYDSFYSDNDAKKLHDELESAKDEVGVMFDVQTITKSEEIRWLSWNLTVSRADGLIYAVGRDITLQKTAEAQFKLKNKQVQLAEQAALEGSEFKSKFMRDLSHNLRNALTGTMGFLQLLSSKAYSNDEERHVFIKTAEESSEQLFTFVTDIIDIAGDQEATGVFERERVLFSSITSKVQEQLNAQNPNKNAEISIIINKKGEDPIALVYEDLFVESLVNTYLALSGGLLKCTLDISVRANTYDNLVEIEILSTPDSDIADAIKNYKNDSTHLVEALTKDKNDVMFNLGLAASALRRLNGGLMIDSLGAGEQNVAMITVPLAKTK